MTQFPDGLGFNLTDALAGDIKDPADLFQGPRVTGPDTEAQSDDLGFPFA